jgi:adenosylhomocysteine nucleosidase
MKYNKIGIICAMATEAEQLLAAMKNKATKSVGSMEFHEGTVGEKKVVLCICGIGKVFAAMCAQTMILAFSPDCIINSGVAGSLTDELEILDIAVAENLVQHDMDTSPLGDPVGLISGIQKIFFDADETAVQTLSAIAEKMTGKVLVGTVCSGDRFVASPEEKDRILSLFESGVACEMEGGAIAHTAYLSRTPFVIVRAISDSADGSSHMDYPTFLKQAAKTSFEMVYEFIKTFKM